MFTRIFAFIVASCLLSPVHGQKIYNIIDFGAKGDGKTINTAFINSAILKCNTEGGGRVLVPAGTFVSGTILFKSDVELYLEAGSVIEGSKDTLDYLKLETALFNEGYNRYGLLLASECKNISISGKGEIFGNGTYFMNGIDKPHLGHSYERKMTRQGEQYLAPGKIFEDGPVSYNFRPGLMLTFDHCENLDITDINLRDSPEWTIRIGECDDVNIRGITILNNQLIPNSDGIHCTTSRNIRISDCNIFVGDDAIIVTGFSDESTAGIVKKQTSKIGNLTGIAENVTVTNCTLSSRSACIRVGYGEHPIRNLIFSNLIMYSSNRGIGVFSRNNSDIDNVLFSNIIIHNRLHSGHWWGKGESIHISAISDRKDGNGGHINNIRFQNIIAESENGILIWGEKNSLVENVMFQNIQLSINAGNNTLEYGGNFDLQPAYPKDSALFKHDIPALYAQYVKNLKIEKFELIWGKNLPVFFTNGIEVHNFDRLTIDGFEGNSASKKTGLAAIKLVNGKGGSLRNNSSPYELFQVIREHIK